MTCIEFKKVCKSFNKGNGAVEDVIKNLSITFKDSSFNTLIGPNGCGKSTFLNLVAGTYKPDHGEIIWREDGQTNLKIGYVWQDYRTSLLPWLNVAENITFPLRVSNISKAERFQIAKATLDKYNINIDLNEKIYNLSGGQQQLASILRAIIIQPDILLFDEPLSALDQLNSWKMAFIIEKIWLNLKIPVFFVSHDIDEAILLADNIMLMSGNSGSFKNSLTNSLSRPRDKAMLSSKEHIKCREEVINFLFEEDSKKN